MNEMIIEYKIRKKMKSRQCSCCIDEYSCN